MPIEDYADLKRSPLLTRIGMHDTIVAYDETLMDKKSAVFKSSMYKDTYTMDCLLCIKPCMIYSKGLSAIVVTAQKSTETPSGEETQIYTNFIQTYTSHSGETITATFLEYNVDGKVNKLHSALEGFFYRTEDSRFFFFMRSGLSSQIPKTKSLNANEWQEYTYTKDNIFKYDTIENRVEKSTDFNVEQISQLLDNIEFLDGEG